MNKVFNKFNKKISCLLIIAIIVLSFSSCKNYSDNENILETSEEVVMETDDSIFSYDISTNSYAKRNKLLYKGLEIISSGSVADNDYVVKKVYVDFTTPYATYSIINDGYALLYEVNPKCENYKGYTVCVNAGHGTVNGSKVKTFSHPDFSPKVTGGTTAAGEILSTAISEGMVFNNKMKEADANLLVALFTKDKLLRNGYNVLMIRENNDARLDNIARTVLANRYADCHIALHFDSTDTDKGVFFIVPFDDETYLNMEPLKSNYDNIVTFGRTMINAFKECGIPVWKDKGELLGDLTQLSYSINPSIDLELGDKATELSVELVDKLANAIVVGIENYRGKVCVK